jgi:hypothetical protein
MGSTPTHSTRRYVGIGFCEYEYGLPTLFPKVYLWLLKNLPVPVPTRTCTCDPAGLPVILSAGMSKMVKN